MEKTMRKLLLAFAAGALACASVLAPIATIATATPAAAQFEIDRETVHPGAVELVAPMPAAGETFASPTTYAPDGQVEVPWGDWLAELIAAAYAIIFGAVLWLLRKVPKSVVEMVDSIARAMGQGGVNELLDKAVGYGINVTKDAVRGKTMTIKVGNEVLERATEYALRHAPGLVAKYGGLATLREKIVARLDLDADAEVPAPRPPVETLIPQNPPPAT